MAVNDTLFQLIRSLTPGEKRYFKLYAARQSEAQKTNYEKLFDEYNKLPENEPYDEEGFIKKLKRKELGKYFSDDKKHLTQLLLKAMRSFAAEKKAEGRLADMIQEMNFLIDKGLMDHCAKICEKAWEIADERELTEQKLRLLAIRRIIDRSEFNAGRESYQNDLRTQEETALAQLATEREAIYLYEHVYCLYVMHQMAGRAADIARIYERLDALGREAGLTFDCINSLIRAKCVILDHRHEYIEALALTRHLIVQWEKKPWRILEMPERYVKLLGNFMVFTSRTGTYEEIGPLIKKLEAIETSEREAAKDVFYLLTFCRLLDCITKKQYTQSLSIIPEIKKGLKDFGTLLTFVQKRTLCTNICLIYLKNKMYPKVLDEVQEVYALVGRGKEKQHRIEDVRVFEFISHYELGNTELLHYMIRNNQRFFKEHQPENDFIDNMWKQLMLFVQDTDKPKLAKQKLKAALLSLPCPDINAALKKELIIWLDGGNG
jgi:hypothetical protein